MKKSKSLRLKLDLSQKSLKLQQHHLLNALLQNPSFLLMKGKEE
jgi:hypothetical protein